MCETFYVHETILRTQNCKFNKNLLPENAKKARKLNNRDLYRDWNIQLVYV